MPNISSGFDLENYLSSIETGQAKLLEETFNQQVFLQLDGARLPISYIDYSHIMVKNLDENSYIRATNSRIHFFDKIIPVELVLRQIEKRNHVLFEMVHNSSETLIELRDFIEPFLLGKRISLKHNTPTGFIQFEGPRDSRLSIKTNSKGAPVEAGITYRLDQKIYELSYTPTTILTKIGIHIPNTPAQTYTTEVPEEKVLISSLLIAMGNEDKLARHLLIGMIHAIFGVISVQPMTVKIGA